MATIKDIAKAAGVSHGTVSNVLNGRGNVSAKKIRLVEEAARQLGYKINYTAQTLRSGVTKSVSIIIPSIESEEYDQLYKGLDKTFSQLGYRTHLYITYDLPRNEKNILKEIAEERVTGIVTISCLDDASIYYEELDIPEDNIIFVNREIKHGKTFVSFDFEQAGTEIGSYLLEQNYRSVGIFADEKKFTNERQFAEAVVRQLQDVTLKTVYAPLNQAYGKAFEFFEQDPPDLIVTTSLSRAHLLLSAQHFGSACAPPEILCLAPTQSTFDSELKKYSQNYQLLGHDIANLLIDQVNQAHEPIHRLIVGNSGIDASRQATAQDSSGTTLTMLTISSPTTDALKKLLPHFTKATGIKVLLAIHTYEEIYQILTDHASNSFFDLIRMDMAWLSWFGKKVFHPLRGLDAELDGLINALPQHIRDNYSDVQGTTYTFPFDPSVQMLFYRKDLFEDQMIKRMYFEKYKKQLTVPTDYAAYNEVARFFSQAHFSHSPTPYGTSLTLGKSEIIALEFLTRYYAEGGKLITEDGIRLEPDKAAKALDNFMETLGTAKQLDELWWGEAVNSFARGETAMVIGFMNHVSRIAHSDVGAFIGSAAAPGHDPLLGGGVVGISRNSAKVHEAIQLIKWINQTEIAEQISLLGGTTANPEVCNNFTIRTWYPWLQEANKLSARGIRDSKHSNGTGIDTKKMELIIGLAIKNALHQLLNTEQTIEHINSQLADM